MLAKKVLLSIVLILSAVFAPLSLYAMGQKIPRPSQSDPQTAVQGLQMQRQENNSWCWVASARMAMSSKTRSLPSQCQIASRTVGRNCCTSPSGACLQGRNPQEALSAYGINSVTRKPNFDEVVGRIKKGKSVIIVHQMVGGVDLHRPASWGGGTDDSASHAVVAYGTYRKNNQDYLLIYDPLAGYRFWDKNNALLWRYTVNVQ